MSLYYWANYGCYDKVYYRVDDKLSFELQGDGMLKWYKTNEKTHRVHQIGSMWCDRIPLFCRERPNYMAWI